MNTRNASRPVRARNPSGTIHALRAWKIVTNTWSRSFFRASLIAETRRAKRVLETSHPPVYYIPPEDVRLDCLARTGGDSFCEWKGVAGYYTVIASRAIPAADAAWFYPNPTPAFASLKNYVAFYPSRMDACFVNGERVTPQPGDFYGGWITDNIVGPFKGDPGTRGW